MNFELKSIYVLYDKVTRKGISHTTTIGEAKTNFITHITKDECEVFTDWVKKMQPQELDNFILSNGFSIALIEVLEPESESLPVLEVTHRDPQKLVDANFVLKGLPIYYQNQL
jgi:hypothetical protein